MREASQVFGLDKKEELGGLAAGAIGYEVC